MTLEVHQTESPQRLVANGEQCLSMKIRENSGGKTKRVMGGGGWILWLEQQDPELFPSSAEH